MSTLDGWERMESGEQARVNRIRVGGYFVARMRRVYVLREDLERRVTLMMRARVEAQTALRDLHRELAHVEDVAGIMTSSEAENEFAFLLESEIG